MKQDLPLLFSYNRSLGGGGFLLIIKQTFLSQTVTPARPSHGAACYEIQ